MLTLYDCQNGVLAKRDDQTISPATVWIDLLRPTREEDALVESALGITVPTREEMQEIEASSRLYSEDGAHFMTAVVLHQKESEPSQTMLQVPLITAMTFILAGNRLVTVRYEEPRAVSMFVQRAQKKDANCMSGVAALIGLIETIIDREADRTERIALEVDRLGQSIFDTKGGQATRSRRHDVAIKSIGREGELTSRSRDSLSSLDRVLTFLSSIMAERNDDKALRGRVKTASRDVSSLSTHIDAIANKIQFLLDATLGMISIEQNKIIKLFSVASVALMPPTLIASIYGMNFKAMPELQWPYGYPMALTLMVISAIVPFVYFKRRGWF
jgi:magnesium transporter